MTGVGSLIVLPDATGPPTVVTEMIAASLVITGVVSMVVLNAGEYKYMGPGIVLLVTVTPV